MDASDVLRQSIDNAKVMQIATTSGSGPWVCTVYFVTDKALNLYWLSYPTRRHSREIMMDRRAAVAIVDKLDQPVIGVQGEGKVEVVEHAPTIQGIMEKYTAKYDTGKDFYNNFLIGKAKHRMYKFTPTHYVLFDEVHFPGAAKTITP